LTNTEAMKLALEALETADEAGFWELQKNAVIALRTAIAEAEKPVANSVIQAIEAKLKEKNNG
jgi:hypothetical protein